MPWTLERAGDGTRLDLVGQVDIFEAAPLHAVLVELASTEAGVTVDLSACGDLDSSALQLILAFRRARETASREVSFTGATGRVSRLLARFGLIERVA